MSTDFPAFLSLASLAVCAIVLAEWGLAQDFIDLRASRQFVHLTVGLFVAIAVISLASPVWLFVSAAVSLVGIAVTFRMGWLRSIHGLRGHLIGTITFPLGVLVLLPFFWNATLIARYPLALAFAVLAVSDPVAALIGRRFEKHRLFGMGPEGKTLAGSTAFGLTAWLISGLWITLVNSAGELPFSSQWIWHMAAMIGIAAAAAEMAARKGWDNLLIVVVVVLVLMGTESDERARFLGWCAILSIGASLLAYRLRFLDASGAVAAGLMGGTILYFGGWMWLVPPVVFFLSSSLLSTWSARRRERTTSSHSQRRGRRRDGVQVLANGAMGCLVVVAGHFASFEGAFWIYSATFAAAAADTFATEVGTALRDRTWSIVSGLPVEPGASGGVSLSGFAASLAGALLVAGSAAAVAGARPLAPVTMLAACGFLAAIVDSLFGATLQVRYRTRDGRITEMPESDGHPNERAGGWGLVNNDTVNFICTLAAAAAVAGVIAVTGS